MFNSTPKIYWFFFAFVLFFFFVSTVNASPQPSIVVFPASVTAGQEFNIVFNASDLEPLTTYHAKALGGNSFTEVDTWNSSWLQQNASWTSMPTFTTSNESSASATIKARFDPNTQSGTKDLIIRITKSSNDPFYDSPIVSVQVTATTSSPTPVPTSTPIVTPTPTITPLPTPTPKISPKPSPTKISENTDTQEENQNAVLGLREGLSEPSPSPLVQGVSEKKFPVAAILLIVGGLIIMGGAGFTLFRKMKAEGYNNSENEEIT